MQFEWYVVNYNHNKKKIEMFNVFSNYHVQKETEAIIKKYLRAPSKFKTSKSTEDLTGFDALVYEIEKIIQWQEWSRFEYEICAGPKFFENTDNFSYLDCYDQCKPNMRSIAHECIRQYKEQR